MTRNAGSTHGGDGLTDRFGECGPGLRMGNANHMRFPEGFLGLILWFDTSGRTSAKYVSKYVLKSGGHCETT